VLTNGVPLTGLDNRKTGAIKWNARGAHVAGEARWRDEQWWHMHAGEPGDVMVKLRSRPPTAAECG
jgi:hypothetical protein